MDQEDTILLMKIQKGEKAAFDIMVVKYLPLVYRYLHRLVGNKENAEELSQESFIRAWKNIHLFDVQKTFKPWLLRIARNCAFDYFRKKKTLPFSSLSETEQFQLENTPTKNASPKELAEKNENAVLVSTLLSLLSDSEKEVLTLHYLDELTVPEIAVILKKPEETIRTRLRRAREAFREAKTKNDKSKDVSSLYSKGGWEGLKRETKNEPSNAPNIVLKSND
jgi:RNA polymerase sigma-70 factor (ECF subfamily)